jgi:hypothetical protein
MEEAGQLKDNLEMLKKYVDEMEKKMKLQRVLKRAHDVVRMLNRAGWNAQTDKVKKDQGNHRRSIVQRIAK